MADETNNKNAVFKFYLNRQGVKGNKGEKGEQGFSPVIEVSENTANSYKLQITTETDQFETPNLRGDEIDTSQSGTYIRYNEETEQMYVGNADAATAARAGVVRLASDEDVSNLSDVAALTPDSLVNNSSSLLQSSDGSIEITQDEVTEKINLKANTSSIEGDITALEARVGTCEGNILSNAGRIQTLEHNLALDEQAIQNNTLAIANKVDKVAGKGLSTNDFTDAEEEKLMHAVVDEDLANVAFTGDYDDLTNKPTIPVIPSNNLTGDSVDGTTIVYDNVTGKISATAATPDLSNYVTKNTAQEINNTKTFLGNSLQVGDGNSSDIVASYDNVVYPTTETGFSRVAGTVIGSLLQGSNSTLATQSMFEYDDDIQDFKIATIFNDFNLTGGTNAAIIKNAQTGKYEIVAHDTVYSQSNGIDINNANQISVKVDGNTIQFNTNGELEAQTYTLPTASTTTLGGVKVDGTTVVVDNNGVLSATAQTPDLSNYVTLNTQQEITGKKILNGGAFLKTSNIVDGNNKFSILRSTQSMSSTMFGVGQSDTLIGGNIQTAMLTVDGDTRPILAITPTRHYTTNATGYVYIPNLVNDNYKPYLNFDKITSTGGTVTITDNGTNGINIEAVSSTPTNMVTTNTTQTITGLKTLNNTLNFAVDNSNSTYSIDRNSENITITASPENAIYTQPLKIGREGTGTYAGLEGYFFNIEDGQNGIWLGAENARSCLTTTAGSKVHIFPNPMVNNASERFTIGLNNELTYRKSDGTVVDLLNPLANPVSTNIITSASVQSSRNYVANPDVSKGTTPSADQYIGVIFDDYTGKTGDDASWAAARLGCVEQKIGSDGSTVMTMSSFQNASNSTNENYLKLNVDSSGNKSTVLQTDIINRTDGTNTYKVLDESDNTVFDGQWVANTYTIANSVSINGSTPLEYSLSSYLPNDSYDYEVLFDGYAITGGTSGNNCPLVVAADAYSAGICRVITRANAACDTVGNAILPVGISRKIAVARGTSYNGNITLRAIAYRRIGTNS